MAGMVKKTIDDGFEVVIAKIDTEGNVVFKKLDDAGKVIGDFIF